MRSTGNLLPRTRTPTLLHWLSITAGIVGAGADASRAARRRAYLPTNLSSPSMSRRRELCLGSVSACIRIHNRLLQWLLTCSG